MARRKEKLLDKLVKKDLNNDLEEVLTKKTFSEEVKNLLLDVLYKIENSYNDYAMVKKNVMPQDDYIQNIIRSVKNNCDYISFIRPGKEKEKSFKVDKQEKKIECYPMARKILYSISKIQKSDSLIKDEPKIIDKALTNLLNVGNNINTVEPLRDFNGFSWDISALDIENFSYNLVYQDLVILCGNQILEEWINDHNDMIDYLDLLREELEKKYGKKFLTEIIKLLKTISILLELINNKEFKKEVLTRKKEIEKELEKMQDKIKYLDMLSEKKRKITDKIGKLDLIICDKTRLAKEYEKRNKDLPLEQKIFSKRVLKIKLNEERENLLSELKECNNKMNSKKFLQNQKNLKYELEYLELVNVEDWEQETMEKIILLQKRVLQAFRLQIGRAKNKEKLIRILYELRYFSLIPVNENQDVSQITKLSKLMDTIKKEAIQKAYELKIINEVCNKNSEINLEVIKNIFSLDIIRLEDIYIKILNDKENMYVQFYDENILDEKIKLDFRFDKKKIKINKKVKLFI